jgi:hypothetical protein
MRYANSWSASRSARAVAQAQDRLAEALAAMDHAVAHPLERDPATEASVRLEQVECMVEPCPMARDGPCVLVLGLAAGRTVPPAARLLADALHEAHGQRGFIGHVESPILDG